MFNRRRNVGLYYAIGIATGVLMLAGAGTLFFMGRRRNRVRNIAAQAKRVIQHQTTHTTTHPKRTRANGHTRGHNARA